MTLTAAVEWKSEQSIVTMTMEMTIMKFGNEDDLLSRTGERGKVGEVLEPGDWDALLGVASCWSTTKGAHSIPAPTLCNMTATIFWKCYLQSTTMLQTRPAVITGLLSCMQSRFGDPRSGTCHTD